MKSTACCLFCFLLFANNLSFAKNQTTVTNGTINVNSDYAQYLTEITGTIGGGVVTSALKLIFVLVAYTFFERIVLWPSCYLVYKKIYGKM